MPGQKEVGLNRSERLERVYMHSHLPQSCSSLKLAWPKSEKLRLPLSAKRPVGWAISCQQPGLIGVCALLCIRPWLLCITASFSPRATVNVSPGFTPWPHPAWISYYLKLSATNTVDSGVTLILTIITRVCYVGAQPAWIPGVDMLSLAGVSIKWISIYENLYSNDFNWHHENVSFRNGDVFNPEREEISFSDHTRSFLKKERQRKVCFWKQNKISFVELESSLFMVNRKKIQRKNLRYCYSVNLGVTKKKNNSLQWGKML